VAFYIIQGDANNLNALGSARYSISSSLRSKSATLPATMRLGINTSTALPRQHVAQHPARPDFFNVDESLPVQAESKRQPEQGGKTCLTASSIAA